MTPFSLNTSMPEAVSRGGRELGCLPGSPVSRVYTGILGAVAIVGTLSL